MPSGDPRWDFTYSPPLPGPTLPPDPGLPARINQLTTDYPTMSSGVTYSLAAGGADPQTTRVAAAADNQVRARKKRRDPGQQVRKRGLTFVQFDKKVKRGQLDLGYLVSEVAGGPPVRDYYMDASRSEKQAYYRRWKKQRRREREGGSGFFETAIGAVTDVVTDPVVAASAIPGIGGGIAAGISAYEGAKEFASGNFVGGVVSTATPTAGRRTIGAGKDIAGAALDTAGPVGSAVSTVVNPAVRSTMIGLNAPYEYLQGAFRDAVSDPLAQAGRSPVEQFQSAGAQTVAGQAIRALANGDPVQVGSGLLPATAYVRTVKDKDGIDVPVTRETPGAVLVPGTTNQYQAPNPEGGTVLAAQKEQEKRGVIGGHVITPGRWFANLIFEPDETAFNVMSGLFDTAVAYYADPADRFLKGTSALRAEARSVRFADEGQEVGDLLQGSAGRGLLKKLSATTTPEEVKGLLPNLSEGRARAISRIDRPENIRGILTKTGPAVPPTETVGRLGVSAPQVQHGGTEGLSVVEQTDVLRAAGGIRTWRKYLDPLTAKEWLASKPGRKVRDRLVEIESPNQVIDFLGKDFPVQTFDGRVLPVELAQARTPGEVDTILESVIGRQTRGFPSGAGYGYRRNTKDVRIFGMVPSNTVDFEDIPGTVQTLRRRMQNAKIDPARQDAIVDQFLQNPGTKANRYRTIDAVMDAEKEQLLVYGVDEALATKMTTAWRDTLETDRMYAVSQDADEFTKITQAGLVKDGELINFRESPSAYGELMNSKLELPSYRDVRRNVSFWEPMFKVPGVQASESLLDAYMTIWRKGKLFRPAWGVRVVGEEQLRMAAAGLASIGRHPISALAWVLGNPESRTEAFLASHFGKVGDIGAKAISKAKTKAGRGMLDISGGTFADDAYHTQGLNRFRAINDDMAARRYGNQFYRVKRDNPQAARGLIEHWSRLNDPVMRQIIDADDLNAVKAWWWDGDGANFRRILSDEPNLRPLADDKNFADAYIDFMGERLATELTGGDTRLIEAFRHLKIDDTRLVDEYGRATDDGIQKVQEVLAEGVGPEYMKVQRQHLLEGTQLDQARRKASRTFDSLMSMMMARPSNYLSRSPAFRQYYWRRVNEIMPYANNEARTAILATARSANLDKNTIRGLRESRQITGELLDAKQIDTIAKAHGLDETRKLLYDLSEKSQFFDTARHIFPFGEAWKEVLTRWAGLAYRNPEVIRRGQQAVQGARGAGWFYKDPQTGEEVFAFGANDLLTNAGLPGPPMPFVGSVQGLNLVSAGLPGVGPAVQIPLQFLIPDTPDWQMVSDLIFPYGRPEDTGDVAFDILTEASPLPSWAEKVALLATDPERHRLYGNRVSHMMNYLASTGEYNLSNPKDLERLYNDAKGQAQDQTVWGLIFQTFSPTAPITDWQVEDKTGSWVNAAAVSADFYDRILPEVEAEGGDWDDAMDQFFEEYGEDNIMLLQPMSRKVKGYLPPEDKAYDWVRKHDELRVAEPDVYGLFAPQGGEFSQDSYNRLLATGEVQKLSPRERLREAQGRIASHIYKTQKDKIDPEELDDEDNREWLREWREHLAEKFEGWKPEEFTVNETQNLIRAVERAANDKRFKKASPKIVRTARAYLAKRQAALDVADGVDLSGKNDAENRQWLREWGAEYVKKNPDFSEMWNEVFARELGDD